MSRTNSGYGRYIDENGIVHLYNLDGRLRCGGPIDMSGFKSIDLSISVTCIECLAAPCPHWFLENIPNILLARCAECGANLEERLGQLNEAERQLRSR